MYRDIKRRLDKLQLHSSTEYTEILQLIQQGAYYDELTEQQKDLYFEYLGQDRDTVESLKDMIYERKGLDNNWRHSKLEYKDPPIPKEKQAEHIAKVAEEIKAYMQTCRDDLDAEELAARREELAKIGELRKAAFYRGERMDQYPLPEWVTG